MLWKGCLPEPNGGGWRTRLFIRWTTRSLTTFGWSQNVKLCQQPKLAFHHSQVCCVLQPGSRQHDVNTVTLQWDMFPQISKGALQHWWVEQYSIAGPDFFFSVSLWELWHRLIRAQGTEHTVLPMQRQECGAMIGNDPMFQPPPRPWQDISRDLSFSSDQELQAAIDHVESHQPLNLAQCLLRKEKERNEAAAVEILLPL